MAFVYPSEFSLDYQPCHYGASRLMFRGPKKNLNRRYYAAIGGTETYGKFIPSPYPDLVGVRLDRDVVNLGCMNAGADVFLNDPDLLDIVSGAELAIVQIVGAQNLTNHFYAVHPRRNDRFLRASPWLQSAFREIDFTDFHFTRHLMQALLDVSPDRFEVVAEELRDTWVGRMTALLKAIRTPTILLWMGNGRPPEAGASPDIRADAPFVDAEMIGKVRMHATAYLEVVYSLEATCEGIAGKAFSALDRPAAEAVPGPQAHREVAAALSDAITVLTGQAEQTG